MAAGQRRAIGGRRLYLAPRQPTGVGAGRSGAGAERRLRALSAARAARLSGRLEDVQKVLTRRG
jgi:hypothetical protein